MQKLMAASKWAVGALAFGMAAVAVAEPVFSVDTGLFQTNAQKFDSDFISGTGSSLLTITSPTTINGQGYIRFNNWRIPGTTDTDTFGLTSNSSNNSDSYLLWAEYSYTTSLVSGSIGAPGSDYKITSMSLTLWGEKANGAANNSVFTQANVSNAGSGTVAHSADTKKLGQTVALVNGVAALNGNGGSSFTPTLSFALTADGRSFFYAPDPFYNIAFGSFTNVASGVIATGSGLISINSANGGVTFAGQLPEPASLALVGVAVLGAGFAARRRKAA